MSSTRRKQKALDRASAQSQQQPKPYDAPLAPFPNFDKYPVVIGSSLTLNYVSSVFRLATTGYRREYVDVLDELLERDPHAYAVLAQRVFGVAGGRLVIEAAECDEGDADAAEEVRADVEQEINKIPDLQQALASLLWAIFYGVSCCEIGWNNDADGWHVSRLFFVHSRRIQYPEPLSWSAHIWDWGLVRSWESIGRDPTASGFGVRIDDFPGKFILHAPQLRGDYPTRDGLGREIAYWMTMKLAAARSASQYIERFANPWAIGYWNTADATTGKERVADQADIDALNTVVGGLGNGLSKASLPSCTSIKFEGPGLTSNSRGLAHGEFVKLCDSQTAKAVLGQSDTVDSGPNGNRSAVETRKEGALELYRYDAACLSDTLERDLVTPLCTLRHADRPHLKPRLRIVFDKPPEPQELATLASTLSAAGVPIDADAIAERCDVPVVPQEKPEGGGEIKPRRMAPLKQVDMFALDSGEPPPPPVVAAPFGAKPGAKPDDKPGHQPAAPADDGETKES